MKRAMEQPAVPCPKCHSVDALAVQQLADLAHVDGAPWFVNVREIAMVANPSPHDHPVSQVITVGRLRAHVCLGCGFTELYTQGAEMLPVDGQRVLLLESDPAYR